MWPNGFAPDEAKLYIRNERTIAAPIETVWAWVRWVSVTAFATCR